MLCKIINLQRAQDRRKRVTRHFEFHGIDFDLVTGIDKLKLSEKEYATYLAHNSKYMNRKHPHFDGHFACCLSHRKLWKQLVGDPGG